MDSLNCTPLELTENRDFVHGLFERRLASGEIELPLLPEVAIRVARINMTDRSNAAQLTDIINADATLTAHVLRIVAAAGRRPATPINTLRHAVTWLGFEVVANTALTLALQGKMLNIPGQHQKARRLWRHSLASALWSRQVALRVGQDAGLSYLCGLLHEIGKPVTLSTVHELSLRAHVKLSFEEYDMLVATFHRHVGELVVRKWGLPAAVAAAATQWESYAEAGEYRTICNVVNAGHRLADFMLGDSLPLARDLLPEDPVFLDLGPDAAGGGSLLDAAGQAGAELDSFLPP